MKKVEDRKKPKFLRTNAHKMIKLGKGVKKNLKWRGAKGRQNKLRLGEAGRRRRPKVGWGTKDKKEIVVVRTLNELKDLKAKVERKPRHSSNLKTTNQVKEIVIGKIGKKKRDELIKKANEMKIKILNKYKKKSENVEVKK